MNGILTQESSSFNYCEEIADSFSALLAGALRSEGRWFWLKE